MRKYSVLFCILFLIFVPFFVFSIMTTSEIDLRTKESYLIFRNLHKIIVDDNPSFRVAFIHRGDPNIYWFIQKITGKASNSRVGKMIDILKRRPCFQIVSEYKDGLFIYKTLEVVKDRRHCIRSRRTIFIN